MKNLKRQAPTTRASTSIGRDGRTAPPERHLSTARCLDRDITSGDLPHKTTMKRCPKCNRDYSDETLNFCLEDGAALTNGVVASIEHATAIFGSSPSAGRASDAFTQEMRNASPASDAANNSVAVLPFVNMSADADNEYFCDGLA